MRMAQDVLNKRRGRSESAQATDESCQSFLLRLRKGMFECDESRCRAARPAPTPALPVSRLAWKAAKAGLA